MSQATALRQLQAALQLRIDAVYAPLPPRVRAILAKLAHGDTLTPVEASLALMELRRLLDAADERAAPVIAQGIAAAGILAEQDTPDIGSAWRKAAGFAAATWLFGVANRLRDGRAASMSQVETVLTGAAASGTPVIEISVWLERWVNPWYANRRDASGVLRRAGRGAPTATANPGMAAANVRGLMVTQTSAAHGGSAIVKAQRTPGALIQWERAPWHKGSDDCDDKATFDSGYGPGVYLPDEVPEFPSHDYCACVLTVVDRADIEDEAA